jgi:hypothetical protein
LLKQAILLDQTVDNMKKILNQWIPLAFVACCVAVLVYGTVQQTYRQSANDPQIQMAEGAALMVSAGGSTKTTGTVDIASSLAPYLVFYDASGKPLAGTGMLDGALPSLPSGVWNSVLSRGGEDRFTWQPRPGVRSAVVVDEIVGAATGTSARFVMAGRSLREVEDREDKLALQIFAGLAFTLIGSLVLVALRVWWEAKKH